MNSFIDIRGLYFLAGAASFVIFILLCYIQLARRTYRGFICWTASSFLVMTGSALIALRDFIPDYLSIITANTLLAISQFCITYGIFLFSGLRVRKSILMLPVIIQVPVFLYFTYGVNSTDIRIVSISLLVLFYMAVNMYIFLRRMPNLLGFTNRLLMLGFWLAAVFCAARILIAVLFPPGTDDFMLYSPLTSGVTLLVSMSFMGIYIGLILLNFQRVEYDLVKSHEEIKILHGLLPICSHCKKIRDDNGEWKYIESYISDHSEAKFSHGICDECAKENYPEMYEED